MKKTLTWPFYTKIDSNLNIVLKVNLKLKILKKNYEKICDLGSSYELLDITPNLQGEEKMINWKPKDLLCERQLPKWKGTSAIRRK